MKLKRLCYLGLALVALLTFTASAVAVRSVSPKTGLYHQIPDPYGESDEFKVVKIGRDRVGIKLSIVSIPMECGGQNLYAFNTRENRPIPIKNGKFSFSATKEFTGAAGAGHGTMHVKISGTFKSPMRIEGSQSVNGKLEFHFPNSPASEEGCAGEEDLVAVHI